MGLLVTLFRHGCRYISIVRLFMTTGILGGYTTFSAFTLETVLLIERHQYGLASIYVPPPCWASIAGLALGAGLVRLTARLVPGAQSSVRRKRVTAIDHGERHQAGERQRVELRARPASRP